MNSDLRVTDDLSPETGDDWSTLNAMGCLYADGADWESARSSFEQALALLPSLSEAPAAHAIVRSNLAQALYAAAQSGATRGEQPIGTPVDASSTNPTEDAGQIERDAVSDGEQEPMLAEMLEAIAARRAASEALSSAPVARGLADFAVMLMAVGRIDDAWTAIRNALDELSDIVGDTDPRLLPVLETAAQIACCRASFAQAEPLLLRAHAIADESGRDVSPYAAWLTVLSDVLDAAAYDAPVVSVETASPATNVAADPDADATSDPMATDVASPDASATGDPSVLAAAAFEETPAERIDAAPAATGRDVLGLDDIELDESAVESLPERVSGLYPAASRDVPPLLQHVGAAHDDGLDDLDDLVLEDAGDLYGGARSDSRGTPIAIPPSLGATPTSPPATNALGFTIEYGIPRDLLLGGEDAA